MKNIVLHIGTEKTATTSLQSFFSMNQATLKGMGIWYPCSEKLDYCHRNAHFPLAASVHGECPDFIVPGKYFEPNILFSKLFDDFKERPERTLLLSAEHFSSRCSKPERLSRLGEIFDGHNVQVVVYLRPQHELLLSAYSTFLKSGGKKTLEEVSTQQWLRPGAIYFNYLRMLERWWGMFGKERITVRIFQKQQFSGGDIYTDFLSVLGVDWQETLFIPERQNPPICKELADFLYIANQHFPNFNEDDRKGWELGQRFRAEITPLFPRGRPLKYLLPDELKADTKAFFADYNAELARNARPELNGILFSDDDADSKMEGAEPDNYFCDEFVTWIIAQWKSGLSLKTKLHVAMG